MLSYFNEFCLGEFQCSEEAVIIAAMTQIQNVFITPLGEKFAAVSVCKLKSYYSLLWEFCDTLNAWLKFLPYMFLY